MLSYRLSFNVVSVISFMIIKTQNVGFSCMLFASCCLIKEYGI